MSLMRFGQVAEWGKRRFYPITTGGFTALCLFLGQTGEFNGVNAFEFAPGTWGSTLDAPNRWATLVDLL